MNTAGCGSIWQHKVEELQVLEDRFNGLRSNKLGLVTSEDAILGSLGIQLPKQQVTRLHKYPTIWVAGASWFIRHEPPQHLDSGF